MSLSLPEYTEIKAMLREGWSVRDIQKNMKKKKRPIGLNTLYDIKNDDMHEDDLSDTKINTYYRAGEGGRLAEMRKRVEDRVHEMTDTMIDDTLQRTAAIETLADAETLNRLVSPNHRDAMSMKDLTGAADSASKRNLLRQGKPTEIFQQFDTMTPEIILQILNQDEADHEDTKRERDSSKLKESSKSLQEPERV